MVKQSLTDTEVITALGGTVKVAGLFGVKPQVVSNWRTRGIPGHAQARVWQLCQQHDISYIPPAVRAAQ